MPRMTAEYKPRMGPESRRFPRRVEFLTHSLDVPRCCIINLLIDKLSSTVPLCSVAVDNSTL